jgi:HAD superfamily hydrolase (TIGR01484 family)
MTQRFATYQGVPRAVFTDLDGTLTTSGIVRPETFAAVAALERAQVPVVVVTGRPAGWGDALVRTWPVTAVIAENGAVRFARRQARVERWCAMTPSEQTAFRQALRMAVDEVMAATPGAGLSQDSRFREIDLAIDWNEDVALAVGDADRMVRLLQARGFAASRSSVHVNVGPAGVDKMTACSAAIKDVLGADPTALADYMYVGDALNDAPMFAGFPVSVGVANVREVWDELPHRPRYITDAAEGPGFEEIAAAILGRVPGGRVPGGRAPRAG